MKLPDYPVPGDPIPASWGRQIVDFLRSLTPKASPEALPTWSPNGTTWKIARGGRRGRDGADVALGDALPLDADVQRRNYGHNGAAAGVADLAAREDHRHDSNMPDGTVGAVLYYSNLPGDSTGITAWVAKSLADLIGAALDNLGIEALPDGTEAQPHLKWDHVAGEWKKALIVPDGSAEGDMLYWHEYAPATFRWERLAAAPASGKFTLVSDNGVLGWVEVADGVCE